MRKANALDSAVKIANPKTIEFQVIISLQRKVVIGIDVTVSSELNAKFSGLVILMISFSGIVFLTVRFPEAQSKCFIDEIISGILLAFWDCAR